jgi:hypothetical protein
MLERRRARKESWAAREKYYGCERATFFSSSFLACNITAAQFARTKNPDKARKIPTK